ncbi:MAG TPA: hypothetical protein PLB52_02895 [Candidatus Moranbacteria bacterium]|nr:hypothetical protein [Candidatus Moranbacteria bacterium]
MKKNDKNGEQPPINGKLSGRRTKRQGKFGNESLNPSEEELLRFQNIGKSDLDEEIKPENSKPIAESEPAVEQVAEPEPVIKQAADPVPNPEPVADQTSTVEPEEEAKQSKPKKVKHKIIKPVGKEKGVKNKDAKGMSFLEFGRKYKDFFQKNAFSDFDETTKEPRGQWVHISSYNKKTKMAECYFGEVGSPNRFETKKEIKVEDLDEILKGYLYNNDGKKIYAAAEKSAPEADPEMQTEADQTENKNPQDTLIKEITYDNREKKKKELLEAEKWGEKYWNIAAEKFDWEKFDDEQKIGALIIMTEISVKEYMIKQSESFGEEEANKKSKEIVEKISEEFVKKINKNN